MSSGPQKMWEEYEDAVELAKKLKVTVSFYNHCYDTYDVLDAYAKANGVLYKRHESLESLQKRIDEKNRSKAHEVGRGVSVEE